MTDENTCSWLIEVAVETSPPADLPDEYLSEWYDQFAGESMTKVIECGAPVRNITDGWECERGHHHYFYGSPSQQFEEQMEAMRERMGYYD